MFMEQGLGRFWKEEQEGVFRSMQRRLPQQDRMPA